MKRVLAWVLLAIMLLGLFAGCKKTEVDNPDVVSAAEAIEYLKAVYPNAKEATKTPIDYERMAVVRIDNVPFDVVWSVDVGEDLIKIVDNGDGTVTIDVNEQCDTDTTYKLTATITDANGKSASWSWDYILPAAMDPGEILKAAYALAVGESLPYEVTLTGKVVSIDTMYSADYQNITVTMAVEGYEEYPIKCYRLKGEGCESLQVGNIITVTGTIKNYNGTIEFDSGCTLDKVEKGDAVDAPTDPIEIVKAAYALGKGESLPYVATLTGKVTEIDSPFDPDYNNISVVIAVEGIEDKPILCYRLKGNDVANVAVDDIITVMGIIKNYNGTVEFDSGCQMIDRISGGRMAEAPSSDPVKIFADAKKLKSGEHLNYYATLTGKVTEIVTPYDSEYNNITVKMVVEGYESTPIICYRLRGDETAKIAKGDTVIVKGIIENYKGTLEFGSGCTLIGRISGGGVAKPESSDAKQILADAAKLASGQSLDYYANLTGKVTEIDSPYDKEYKNISVYMTVNGKSMLCYRLKSGDADVSKIAVGDTITVRGVIENYKGEIQFGSGSTLTKRVSGGGVAKPESSNASSILADAAKLAQGEKLTYYANLTGKVTSIDTPYDKEYKNISVYINVNGTSMLCYRLKSGDADVSKIAVGDTITVRGVIENYKGDIQFGSGSTLAKRVSGGGTAKPESSNAATILADAAKLKEGEALSYYANLTGKVTAIDTPYDKEYGNISVVMNVNGTSMLCYRLKSGDADVSKIAVGDTITVRGVIENYKGDIQFGSGSTLTKRVSGGGVAKPESSNAAAILADAAKLKDGEALSYYANLTGKVTAIDTPYDKEYGNISVVIDVDGTSMLCYRLKSGAADASKIAVGDTITVRGVIENYKGEIQFGSGSTLTKRVSGGGTAKPESSNQADILADAAKLESGERLSYYANLTGKVTAIDTPYDKEYENISVVIDVEGTSMLCYRLKSGDADVSKIAEGDTITVRGVIENYNGEIQFGSGSTLEKRVSGGGVAKPESSDLSVIWPDAQALAKGESLSYYATLSGKVTEIKEAYTTQYSNISVYIDLENGENILCYRLKSGDADASKIRVGDTITVRGVIMNFMGDIQFGQGCTLEKLVEGYNPGDNMTPEQIVDAAYGLSSGGTLEGQYTLTGVISSVDTAYSSQHKNITVTIKVANREDKPIQCYRLASGAAEVSGLKVGDTITVTGSIVNYNGKVQFDKGSVLDKLVSGSGGVEIPDGSVTISFADKANRVSLSGEQQIWKQNNITVTNNKADSNQDIADYANPVRFYKGTSVTIEYPDMTRIVFNVAFSDRVEALTSSLSTMDGIVVTVDGLLVTVDLYEATDSFEIASMANQTRIRDITVCTGTTPPEDGGNTGGDSGNTGGGSTDVDYVTSPVACTGYKMGMDKGDGTILYFNGQTESEKVTYRLATTTDINEAVDVYLESVSGGYLLYFMNGSTKTYIQVIHYTDGDPGWGKGSLKLVTGTPDTYYTYDTTANTLVYDYDGNNAYFMGTYGTYATFSVSNTSFITGDKASTVDVSQFPARFYTSDGSSSGGSTGGDSGNQGGTTTAPTVVDTPVAGTAYKFGMINENKSTTDVYYLAGGMSGYYMATTTDVSAAIDVYLEATTGGYYLYTGTGSDKQYINMVVSGTHVNGVYAATASTVYSYDAQSKTVIASIDGEDYWFGTRNDNTYTTIGPCKTSFNGFYAKFYTTTGGSTGGDSGSGDSGNQGGTTTPSVVDTPVAGTAYKFGMINENKSTTDVYYLAGGMSGYYMATTTDVSAAIDVYLEATSGGYYLYTGTGSNKQYINMVVSGTHVNGVYAATASTVYTYDAQSKTVIASIDGADYWFGTRNDNTYTTIGPCKTSFNGFYAKFYTTTGGSTGGDSGSGDSGNQGGTTTAPTVVDTPVAGTAYKFGMINENKSTTDVYYLAGGMSGYYMATTTDVSAAIDVYLEATSGGYYLYTGTGSDKQYINMVVSGTHVNGVYAATASTVYSYDAQSKTVIASIDGEDYWFGTRNDNTYTTIGPCKTSYNGFYGKFYTTSDVDNSGSSDDSGSTTIPTTPAEIINAAYALEKGESLPYTSTLTGVIVSVDEAYTTQYNNITVTIQVAGSEAKPIKCFRIKGTGVDVIAVGDTITVTGTLTNYEGTIEFATGSALDSYVKGTGGDTGSGTEDATFVMVTDVSQILDGGEFVIAALYDGEYKVLNTSINSKISCTQTVTVTDSKITGQDVPVWTVEAMDSGVSLFNGLNYLKFKSGTSFATGVTEPYEWLIEEDGDSNTFGFMASGDNTRWICYQYRDNTSVFNRFGTYKATASNMDTGYYSFYLTLFEKTAN